MNENKETNYSNFQLTSLVVLRVLIGWHLLYEGVVKLANPNWSSSAYLKDSKWIFSGIFNWIAENPDVLSVVDFINMWALTIIGAALIAGLFTKYAAIGAAGLLGLYFLAAPPFIGLSYTIPFEGNYLFVNKNLIEIAALIVLLLFPTSQIIGLDRLVNKLFKRGN